MNSFYFFFLLGFLGCCWGSFLMVIGERVPSGQSFIVPRSHCSHCQTTLKAGELIPLLSYILQRGRCRHCKRAIPLLCPLTEFLMGVLAIFLYLVFSSDVSELLMAILFVSFSLILSISDLRYMLLPDSLLASFLGFSVVLRFFHSPLPVQHHLFSGVFFFCLFYLFYWVAKDGLGGGDVKLYGIIGWILGFRLTLVALFLTCLLSLVVLLLLMALKVIDKKTQVPFAPFIFLGALLSYFHGKELIQLITPLLFEM